MEVKNNYFGWRHGRSLANEAGIIASSVAGAGSNFGLTKVGIEQTTRTITQWRDNAILGANTLFFTSPLLRARQTARIGQEVLGTAPARLALRLRERFFGALDGGSDSQYGAVWELDAVDPTHTRFQVESVQAVFNRTTAFIAHCERHYHGIDIVLVSHGDTLQILRTAFAGISPAAHRVGPPLDTAELIRLNAR